MIDNIDGTIYGFIQSELILADIIGELSIAVQSCGASKKTQNTITKIKETSFEQTIILQKKICQEDKALIW